MKTARYFQFFGSLGFKAVITAMLTIAIGIPAVAPFLFGFQVLTMFNTGGAPMFMFSSVLDISTFTFTADELRSLKEMVKEAIYSKPTVEEYLTVETDIVAKSKIGILGKFGLVGKKGRLGSNPTPTNEAITGSIEKEWDPRPYSMRIEESYEDVLNSLAIFLQQKGIKRADMTETDYVDFIEERLKDAMWEAVLRHAWFDDVDMANTNDSPAGTLAAGVNVDYFNVIDGYFKQLLDITVTDPNRRVEIAKNSEATYNDQAFDDTDVTNKVATKFYANLLTQADMRLRGDKTKLILSTQSLVDQYIDELESQQVSDSFIKIENGMTIVKRRGVTIVAFDFWDRYIQTYFNDGTKYYLPHRAVLMTKDNFRIGFEDDTALTTLNVFYDQYHRVNVYEFEGMIDVKIVEDYKVQFGY